MFPKFMIERYPAQHWPPTVVQFGSSRSPGNFQLFPPLLQWEPYHLHSIGTCNRLLKPSAYWAAANWAKNLRWCDFVRMLPYPDFELTEQCWCKQVGFMIPTQSHQDSRGYSRHSAFPYLHISSCISSVHLPFIFHHLQPSIYVFSFRIPQPCDPSPTAAAHLIFANASGGRAGGCRGSGRGALDALDALWDWARSLKGPLWGGQGWWIFIGRWWWI